MANDYTNLFSLLTTIGMIVIETLKKKSYRKKSWNSDQDLIRQFRHLPRSILEESGGTASTKPMDALVSDALKELKIDGGNTSESEIAANWTKVVGRGFARKCAPERLTDDGYLIVQVAGSAAKQELLFTKREILFAIKVLPKCGFVREIRFV